VASAREQIRSLVLSGHTYDQPAATVRELQLEAAREAFTAHRERIPLLRTRADETGIREITGPDDLVPLLFSHTSYKSYPLSMLEKGRFEQLTRWLQTLTAVDLSGADTAPFDLSTARNTMFPGASKVGGVSLSSRPSM